MNSFVTGATHVACGDSTRARRFCRSCNGGKSLRIVATRYFFPLLSLKNGFLDNFSAVGLLFGDFSRQLETSSSSSLQYLFFKSLDKVGEGSCTDLDKILSAFMSEFGALPVHNSMMVIPNDQISAFASYSFLSIISGAIQQGVPTKLFLLEIPLATRSFEASNNDEETLNSSATILKLRSKRITHLQSQRSRRLHHLRRGG